YYDLTFKSFDGAKIYAKYIRPNHERKVPTVIQFHDYKESSKSWFHLTRFIGIDYGVVAMDCRGQGGKSEDIGNSLGSTVCGHLIKGIDGTVDDLYYRKVYLDAYLLSKIVAMLDHTDSTNVMTFGIGQGGALALVVAALNPNIKKCSAKDPFLADFYRVWEMDLDQEFYEGIRYYFKWFDPMHEREMEFFNKLSYVDVVHFAPMLTQEVLLATSLLNRICPPSTQFAVYNHINSQKNQVLFAKHGHELNNAFEFENLKFMGSLEND
ncbi:MAG: acetylxylan esterase, partial [Turicibacter sp.]